MADVYVLMQEDTARIEQVASELFEQGPRLTGDDRSRLAAVLRDVLKYAIVVDEADIALANKETP